MAESPARLAGLGGIAEVNALPPAIREQLYLRLVPEELFRALGFERAALRLGEPDAPVRISAPDGGAWARVEVRPAPGDRDPTLVIDVGMSAFAVPELAFVQLTDVTAPRYDIDRDREGQDTLFGTASRNISEEVRALDAGLGPGQVRRGLRMLGRVLECMDGFCRLLGSEFYLVEPLFYHSAILYERRGCDYLLGRERMEEIDAGFGPGGALRARLDDSTPFRRDHFAGSVRGRSWAIHDAILGEPYSGVKMYRVPGHDAGVSTFTGSAY
ncbi:MAG: hypothetical protein HY294_14670 [Candidatus Rokubacteria bacterium]|nr:hypothetical protein [Candidatus Rokubacteria bacterium]MBI3827233.1 hypothetical protein [Candidatus Rokubacteria bacterium]